MACSFPLFSSRFGKTRGALIRGLAHPSAFGGDGGGGFIDFETFGAVPVNSRALFKLLKKGEPTLLYPGGVREAFKSTKAGESYQLFWPSNSSDFAPLAARFNATIVPVAAVGAEEAFDMILDADELLSLPVLGERIARDARDAPVGRVGERFVAPLSVPKPPDRFYFLFGKPISTSEVEHTDEEACAELYQEIRHELEGSVEYLLEKRMEVKSHAHKSHTQVSHTSLKSHTQVSHQVAHPHSHTKSHIPILTPSRTSPFPPPRCRTPPQMPHPPRFRTPPDSATQLLPMYHPPFLFSCRTRIGAFCRELPSSSAGTGRDRRLALSFESK